MRTDFETFMHPWHQEIICMHDEKLFIQINKIDNYVVNQRCLFICFQ